MLRKLIVFWNVSLSCIPSTDEEMVLFLSYFLRDQPGMHSCSFCHCLLYIFYIWFWSCATTLACLNCHSGPKSPRLVLDLHFYAERWPDLSENEGWRAGAKFQVTQGIECAVQFWHSYLSLWTERGLFKVGLEHLSVWEVSGRLQSALLQSLAAYMSLEGRLPQPVYFFTGLHYENCMSSQSILVFCFTHM